MKKWYDNIAKVYDFFTARFYKKMRRDLTDALDIRKGDNILIIACGTGQSFEMLERKTGSGGQIIAVDYSAGMLEQARKRIEKNHWTNIRLIQADARDINREFLNKQGLSGDFDVVIGELAFSVIPDWQKVMKTSVSLLKENGKIGLLDWYRPKNDWLTRIVDFLAKAETTRNTPDYAEELMKEFKIVKRYFFDSIYVGVGYGIRRNE